MDDVYGLGEIADEIDDLRQQLEDAYGSRVEAILEAMADGHSLREVAEHLRMSHTAVAKALDGIGDVAPPETTSAEVTGGNASVDVAKISPRRPGERF